MRQKRRSATCPPGTGRGMLATMLSWLRRRFAKPSVPPEIVRSRLLIRAIDRGGIPLNPARVNDIARNLGLEVSLRAPVEQTIARIRACVERAASN